MGDSKAGGELPEGWPETYSAAGRSPHCPHQMHWDSENGVYRCVHECGEVDEEPPQPAVDAYRKQAGESA